MGGRRTFAGFEVATVAGVPVLHRRDAACKTFRVAMLWQRPRGADQAARALLPALMQHGTASHPDRPALARARERLYGAGGGCGVGRHGETTVLVMSADAVAGAFLPGHPEQFGATMALVQEQVRSPRFRSAADGLFERERAQALAAARAVIDDKTHHARLRAVTIACAGEPYGIPDHGGEAAILALQPGDPVAALDDFLAHGRRAVLLTGALPDDPAAAIAPVLAALPTSVGEALAAPRVPPPRPSGRTVERASMQQAKLVLVYRLPVPTTVAQLCARQVALSMWGGGAHSRLFQEVRERRSLCYYASVGGDVDKGLALVQVGCDAASIAAVVDGVQEQLTELAAGRFTDAELATAIAATQGPYRAIDDSPASRLSYTADQWLRGFDQEPSARIGTLGAVGRADVMAALASLWLDHEYSLVPEETP